MIHQNEHYKEGLPPIVAHGAKLLILGSIPSDRSLALQQYYGHKQNRFWPLLSYLLNEVLPNEYQLRLDLLYKHKIALWDVVHSAIRKCSSDNAIVNGKPNDLEQFLKDNPSIECVAFNGKKASHMYDTCFERRKDILYFDLPSTSPANAISSIERLASAWESLFD